MRGNYSNQSLILGFYQKETFDLRKSKNSRSNQKHTGVSEHSSNISFNHGNEQGPTNDNPHNYHSRKSTYDQNKSYVGNSYDRGNIFKHERMSVNLLNNTNY
jgi:hypothetical protein